jgi:hypothetical protein
MRNYLLFLATAAALAAPRPCSAETRLGIGADYLTDNNGILQLTLSGDTPLARAITVGGRVGALLESGPFLGAPLDVFLRIHLGRIYVDGLIGPWFFFAGPDAVRLHGGLGFGLLTRGFNFGLEVGGLSASGGLVGLRLAFRI